MESGAISVNNTHFLYRIDPQIRHGLVEGRGYNCHPLPSLGWET